MVRTYTKIWHRHNQSSGSYHGAWSCDLPTVPPSQPFLYPGVISTLIGQCLDYLLQSFSSKIIRKKFHLHLLGHCWWSIIDVSVIRAGKYQAPMRRFTLRSHLTWLALIGCMNLRVRKKSVPALHRHTILCILTTVALGFAKIPNNSS